MWIQTLRSQWIRNQYLWITSALFFFLSFTHVIFGVVTLCAAALLCAAIMRAHGWREVVWGSVFVGTLKAAGGILWVWHVYPLVWLNIPAGFFQIVLIGIFWFAVALAIGVGMIATGLSVYFLRKRRAWLLFLFPILFVLGEVVGSVVFSLYSLGPGSYGIAHFGFGYAGVALGYIPIFIPFSIFGGVYALSAVAALIGYLVYEAYYRSFALYSVNGACVIGVILLTASANAWVHMRSNDEVVPDAIAVVTNFESKLFATSEGYALQREEIRNAVTAASTYNPELVLLPEDARFTTSFSSSQAALAELRAHYSSGVIVDSSRTVDERGETVLRAFLYDVAREQVHVVDKQYLVPQGEYIPYLIDMLLRLIGAEELRDAVGENQNYVSGKQVDTSHMSREIPRVLFCFESAVPFSARTHASETSFIVHPVSHGWFHDPWLLRPQLQRMLQIQAVWNNVTILQTGNLATSVRYEPDGTITYGDMLESHQYWSLYRYNES